ncbi:MAG: hypothetical protein H6767_03600 [Candidatus Peribacteria bacterium]|nr:MAG: hypothetical protein H6767_03600 [Candidatus Peribacteria bacterium]
MAKLFIDNGISAGFVHGSMSDDEQERRIRRFKNGFYKVLFSADLLIDGYNDADLAAVFNLSPSRSRVVVEQR